MKNAIAIALLAASLAPNSVGCEDLFPDPPGRSAKNNSPRAGDDEDDEDEPPAKSDKKKPKKKDPKPVGTPTTPLGAIAVVKNVVEMGIVPYPKETQIDPADYRFNVPIIAPPKHHVGYQLSSEEAASVKSFYKDFAKSVGYKRITDNSFSWSPPSGCPSDMSCVYGKLVKRTRPDIVAIAKRFLAWANDKKLTSFQTAELMLAFVQAIPYALPDDPFGLKPPPAVLAERSGDCDSKALVLYLMLEAAGIEAVIIGSNAHAHTMVGIALPAPGKSFTYRSRKYAFAEVTAIGSPIGHINPPLESPNDWRVEWSASK